MRNLMLVLVPGIILFLIAISFSCGDKADPFRPVDNPGIQITYTDQISFLLNNNCVECHASNKEGAERNGAPIDVNLDTYENVIEVAERANIQIQAGTMPPTGGLQLELRALFQQWINQGLEE